MQLGMIGLGRMGANMVRRVIRKGHECVVFDRSAKAVGELAAEHCQKLILQLPTSRTSSRYQT